MNPNSGKSALNSELASFYKSFPWQLFCTFTFSRSLRNGDWEARSLWQSFVNELERLLGHAIGRLVAEESRHASGSLSGIRLHYHALMACDHPLSEALLRGLWRKYAGDGTKLAEIRPYDPSRGAVEYCLKLLGSFSGEIMIQNLDLYSPASAKLMKQSSRARRRQRRHLERKLLIRCAKFFGPMSATREIILKTRFDFRPGQDGTVPPPQTESHGADDWLVAV